MPKCHHRYRPFKAQLHYVWSRCDRCHKERKRPADPCPSCSERRDEHQRAVLANAAAIQAMPYADRVHAPSVPVFVPGCEACFMGYLVPVTKIDCCCWGNRAEPCPPCFGSNNGDLIHVCDYETAEEIDRAAALMLMAKPATVASSKRERGRVTGQLEHGNGERMHRTD